MLFYVNFIQEAYMDFIRKIIPDKIYISLQYLYHMKKLPNIQEPKTYNEKLQWLKLYDRNPLYTRLVDKITVKDYVADAIGKEYIIPTLKIWNNSDEIDFTNLPDKFVIKCNHDSQSVFICKDKAKVNIKQVKDFFGDKLKNNAYWYGREWPYKNVVPRILAEKYMEDSSGCGELTDYKVLCFNGHPKLIEIHMGRFGKNHTQDIYDENWNKTEINQPGSPISNIVLDKPVFFDEMMDLSRKLSAGIPHVRVDWYYTNERLYFGELTFFDGSGYTPFNKDYDLKLGEMLLLPEKKTV